jgi:hypothetical protein
MDDEVFELGRSPCAMLNSPIKPTVRSTRNGDFEKTLGSIKAIVLPGQTDLYFTPEDSEYEAKHMLNAILRPISSLWRYFAGGGSNPVDTQFIDDSLKELLATYLVIVTGEQLTGDLILLCL